MCKGESVVPHPPGLGEMLDKSAVRELNLPAVGDNPGTTPGSVTAGGDQAHSQIPLFLELLCDASGMVSVLFHCSESVTTALTREG